MSAAEWVRQEEARRSGKITQGMMPAQSSRPVVNLMDQQLMPPMPPMVSANSRRPSSQVPVMAPMAPMVSANSRRPSSQAPVMAPRQLEEPTSGPAFAIARGIKESIEAQKEGLRRNAVIMRDYDEKPVRLSSLPDYPDTSIEDRAAEWREKEARRARERERERDSTAKRGFKLF